MFSLNASEGRVKDSHGVEGPIVRSQSWLVFGLSCLLLLLSSHPKSRAGGCGLERIQCRQ